jgi:hypothetical protein
MSIGHVMRPFSAFIDVCPAVSSGPTSCVPSPNLEVCMKRSAHGYRPRFAVVWNGKKSRPALMHWALEVARRMRSRGHSVVYCRV